MVAHTQSRSDMTVPPSNLPCGNYIQGHIRSSNLRKHSFKINVLLAFSELYITCFHHFNFFPCVYWRQPWRQTLMGKPSEGPIVNSMPSRRSWGGLPHACRSSGSTPSKDFFLRCYESARTSISTVSMVSILFYVVLRSL